MVKLIAGNNVIKCRPTVFDTTLNCRILSTIIEKRGYPIKSRGLSVAETTVELSRQLF